MKKHIYLILIIATIAIFLTTTPLKQKVADFINSKTKTVQAQILLFSDDFNRVDSSNLGSNWTERDASGTNFDIIGNKVKLISNYNNSVAYYSGGVLNTADYFVQATVNHNGTVGSYLGVVGRRVNYGTDDSDGYYAFITTDGYVQLFKRLSGIWTQITFVAQTINNNQDYLIKLQMQGSAIKVFLNDIEKISVIDTSFTAIGDAGITAGSWPQNNVLWDNFIIEDLNTK